MTFLAVQHRVGRQMRGSHITTCGGGRWRSLPGCGFAWAAAGMLSTSAWRTTKAFESGARRRLARSAWLLSAIVGTELAPGGHLAFEALEQRLTSRTGAAGCPAEPVTRTNQCLLPVAVTALDDHRR